VVEGALSMNHAIDEIGIKMMAIADGVDDLVQVLGFSRLVAGGGTEKSFSK